MCIVHGYLNVIYERVECNFGKRYFKHNGAEKIIFFRNKSCQIRVPTLLFEFTTFQSPNNYILHGIKYNHSSAINF